MALAAPLQEGKGHRHKGRDETGHARASGRAGGGQYHQQDCAPASAHQHVAPRVPSPSLPRLRPPSGRVCTPCPRLPAYFRQPACPPSCPILQDVTRLHAGPPPPRLQLQLHSTSIYRQPRRPRPPTPPPHHPAQQGRHLQGPRQRFLLACGVFVASDAGMRAAMNGTEHAFWVALAQILHDCMRGREDFTNQAPPAVPS